MFCEVGFVTIGSALSEWRATIDEKFEKETAAKIIADKYLGPSSQHRFDEYQKRDGPKQHFDDLFAYVSSQIQKQSEEESLEVFMQQLKKQDIYLYDGSKTLRAAPEILQSVHERSFREEFWDEDLNEICEITVLPSTVRRYVSLPVFCERIMCFIDPYTWSVDPRGFEAICERVRQVIDPLRLQVWLDDADLNLDNVGDELKSGFVTEFEKIQQLIDGSILSDEEDVTLQDASDTQLMYLCEYNFPILKNVQLEVFKQYKGASLCLKSDGWTESLNTVKTTPYEEFKLSGGQKQEEISTRGTNTIGAERRAVAQASVFLAQDDWGGTTSELRDLVKVKLGERAWRRVIDELRKDFPEISAPGRRRRKP